MASNDTSADQRDNVIAAARAAASWVHARRATWTDVPMSVRTAAPTSRPARPEIELPFVSAPAASPPRPSLPPTPVAIAKTGPSIVARATERMQSVGAPLARWLPRAAAAVALGAVVLVGGRYLWNAAANRPARTAVVAPVAVRPAASKRKPTGDLHVISNPGAAQVLIDGKLRGVTPLTIPDLAVGRHAIELKSVAGTVQRTVTVAADKVTEMNESIFSGWVALYSPFDLVVTEGGRALLMDDRHQIMLSPGRHVLRLMNRTLAFDAVRQVDLVPGEVTNLTVAPPPSTVTVTATEAADVWIDGARVGETPLNELSVPLGTHEIVVKRAAGGERRMTVTVTVNPFTLHVDFSRPAG